MIVDLVIGRDEEGKEVVNRMRKEGRMSAKSKLPVHSVFLAKGIETYTCMNSTFQICKLPASGYVSCSSRTLLMICVHVLTSDFLWRQHNTCACVNA